MKALKQMQYRILKGSLILNLVIIAMTALTLSKPLPIIFGLIFGASISALNFVELANTLNRAVLMPPDKAQSFTVFKYFIRYFVMTVVIYVSIVAPYINVIGTFIGLISIKLIILVSNLLGDKKYFKNIFKRKEDESSGH